MGKLIMGPTAYDPDPYPSQAYAPPLTGIVPQAPGFIEAVNLPGQTYPCSIPPVFSAYSAPASALPAVQTVQVVQTGVSFGTRPQRLTCPHCQSEIMTKVTYEVGNLTHLAALGFCLTGFVCCICVPYMFKELKDTTHECPTCNRLLGCYRRI